MAHKRFVIFILLIILTIPFFVNAETCSTSGIVINSIQLKNISGNTEEISKASVNQRKIKLDLKLYDPGDSIEYNLKITNNSNNDVSIAEATAPIYMWFDDGIIYWWSEEKTPSLNSDA